MKLGSGQVLSELKLVRPHHGNINICISISILFGRLVIGQGSYETRANQMGAGKKVWFDPVARLEQERKDAEALANSPEHKNQLNNQLYRVKSAAYTVRVNLISRFAELRRWLATLHLRAAEAPVGGVGIHAAGEALQ